MNAKRPGELVHVDILKQGKIPDGGGWRIHGRERLTGSRHHRGLGYDFVHAAVDDRSRVAHAKILPDEHKETASAFMNRALGYFASRGITLERVLTNNGACYRSRESPARGPMPAWLIAGPAPIARRPTARSSAST